MSNLISVPRDDLALALGTQEEGVTPYLQKRAGDRLRALLAKPAKPAIEISLKLLNTACNGFVQEQGHALNELREILSTHKADKNVKSTSVILDSTDSSNSSKGDSSLAVKSVAAQPQGEPVHMVRTHGSVCWEEITGESLELCKAQPDEYEVRALYAHPAEQSAASTTSDKYKAELYDEVWQLARDLGFGNVTDALMKLEKQPAPVAVVLPERADAFIGSYDKQQGWNSCLDEVARLSGVKP